MGKTGFMCQTDYDIELPMGQGSRIFPTLAAAKCCQAGTAWVEIHPVGTPARERSALPNNRWSRATYFMREVDLAHEVPLPEDGAPIYDSLERVWRATPAGARSIVRVELRLIQTIPAEEMMKARAFVYEDLYHLLGLVHPGVTTVQ